MLLFPGFTWRHLALVWKVPWQVGWQWVPWQHSPNRGVCLPAVNNTLHISIDCIHEANVINKLWFNNLHEEISNDSERLFKGCQSTRLMGIILCGGGLDNRCHGTWRPLLVIRRKWQNLWQILGKRVVTDAPAESQMCPSCSALRMDTCVSLRLK